MDVWAHVCGKRLTALLRFCCYPSWKEAACFMSQRKDAFVFTLHGLLTASWPNLRREKNNWTIYWESVNTTVTRSRLSYTTNPVPRSICYTPHDIHTAMRLSPTTLPLVWRASLECLARLQKNHMVPDMGQGSLWIQPNNSLVLGSTSHTNPLPHQGCLMEFPSGAARELQHEKEPQKCLPFQIGQDWANTKYQDWLR